MIDILIPVKDNPDVFALTLSSIFHQDIQRKNIHVIVRDEGQVSCLESRTCRMMWDLVAYKYKATYIRDPHPVGLVESRRILLDQTKNKFLLWLDGDILLPVSALNKFYQGSPDDFGFMIPIILDVDNARKHVDYTRGSAKTIDNHRALGASRNYIQCDEEEVDVIYRGNGGCMFCRTDRVKVHVKYDFSHITTGEGEDMIASILLADNFPCYLHTGVVVQHMIYPTHQWEWAKAAGSMAYQYLEGKVKKSTLEKSLLGTAGYKKV